MNGIDILSLRTFVTVCELRSVTEAARHLGTTQAAVSQRLKKLEATARLQLLDREHRPIELTVPGQSLFKRASRILAEIDRLDHDICIHSNLPLPELRIGVADSFGSSLVPPLVKEVKDAFVQLAVRVDSSSTICRLLIERQLHAVVSCDALIDRDDLERHELFREPLVLVQRKGANPGLEGAALLKWLVEERPFIRYSPISPLARQIETHLLRLGLRPKRRMEFNASEPIVEMVRQGLGWTITTPLCLMQARIALDALDVRNMPKNGVSRSVLLLARRRELGNVPRELANISRRIIREHVIGRIASELPWVAPRMQVLPAS